MRTMKKLLSLLFTGLLLGSVLLTGTGCHGKIVEETEDVKPEVHPFEVPAEFDTKKNIEISFWAKNDTNVYQTRIYEKAVEDFQALYPNVKVNLRLYTDYGRIYNDVITNIATKTTPDVCITYPDHIATYMTGEDVVVPLDTLIENEKYGLAGSALLFDSPSKDEIVPKFYEECALDGYMVALPYMRSTEALYINQTFVEKLGFTVPDVPTWDWIFEVSEAAMEKDASGKFKLNGQKVMIPFIYKSTDNMMISYLKQSGAEYSTADGEVRIFNETTEEFLYEISKHAGTGAFSTFKISSYPSNFLNAGQSIFGIDSTAGATWMGTDAPLSDIDADSIVEFETVVRPIPQADPANPQMISQGPSVCLFYKEDPQEVLASWLFMQFLLTNEVQMAYAETEGYVPVTLKAQQDPAYLDYLARSGEDNDTHYSIKIDATKLLIENTENTFVTPVFNGSASLRDAAGQLIENVTKSMRRKETVDGAYMRKMYSEVKSLYRLERVDRKELGELPPMATGVLIALVSVWVILLVIFGIQKLKARKP